MPRWLKRLGRSWLRCPLHDPLFYCMAAVSGFLFLTACGDTPPASEPIRIAGKVFPPNQFIEFCCRHQGDPTCPKIEACPPLNPHGSRPAK